MISFSGHLSYASLKTKSNESGKDTAPVTDLRFNSEVSNQTRQFILFSGNSLSWNSANLPYRKRAESVLYHTKKAYKNLNTFHPLD